MRMILLWLCFRKESYIRQTWTNFHHKSSYWTWLLQLFLEKCLWSKDLLWPWNQWRQRIFGCLFFLIFFSQVIAFLRCWWSQETLILLLVLKTDYPILQNSPIDYVLGGVLRTVIKLVHLKHIDLLLPRLFLFPLSQTRFYQNTIQPERFHL